MEKQYVTSLWFSEIICKECKKPLSYLSDNTYNCGICARDLHVETFRNVYEVVPFLKFFTRKKFIGIEFKE